MRPGKPLGIGAPASLPGSRMQQDPHFSSLPSPPLSSPPAPFCSPTRSKEHHLLDVWKSTPPGATAAWKRVGELAAVERSPAKAPLSCVCVSSQGGNV